MDTGHVLAEETGRMAEHAAIGRQARRAASFSVELFSFHESPQCQIADLNTAGAKLGMELGHREPRVGGGPLQDPVALILQARTTVPSHRFGSDAAGLAKTMRPFQDHACADAIARSNLPVGCTVLDSGDHRRSQLLRIWAAGFAPARCVAGAVKRKLGARRSFGCSECKLAHDVARLSTVTGQV
jgi:hypothetical protein